MAKVNAPVVIAMLNEYHMGSCLTTLFMRAHQLGLVSRPSVDSGSSRCLMPSYCVGRSANCAPTSASLTSQSLPRLALR